MRGPFTVAIRVTACAERINECMRDEGYRITASGSGQSRRWWWWVPGHRKMCLSREGIGAMLRDLHSTRSPTLHLRGKADQPRIWGSVAEALLAMQTHPLQDGAVLEWVSANLE